MNYCECGNKIPCQVSVDGKRRNLSNRTKCLTCLPFGTSPYSKRTPEELRARNSAKQRSWLARQKLELGVDVIKKFRQKRKRDFIVALGGRCQLCGYNRVISSLAFHHLRDKVFELDERRFQYSMQKIFLEAVKCILICHNCHGEVHAGLIDQEKIDTANAVVNDIVANYQTPHGKCARCGNDCKRTFCSDCDKTAGSSKAKYPPDDEFIAEVQRTSGAAVARRLGISATFVLNRYHRLVEL